MSNSVVIENDFEGEDWQMSRADELQSQPYVENVVLFIAPRNEAGPFAFDGCTTDISGSDDRGWRGGFDDVDSNGSLCGSYVHRLEKVEGTAFHISTIKDIWAAKKLLTRLKLTRKYYIWDFSGGTRCDIPSEPFHVALMRRDGTYDQAEHGLIKLAA